MKNFKNYYLAVYGDLDDQWNLTKEFEEEIDILAEDDEDLKHELLLGMVISFNYVINKVFFYLNQKKLKNF